MGTAETDLAQIAAEVRACTRCDLFQGARNGVPGAGSATAEVMLIGEAPSGHDDRTGLPFSGPSGAYLQQLLRAAGLNREQVYLTNLVRHRVPEGQTLEPRHVAACTLYLDQQLAAVRPLLVVALGRGAAAYFLPRASVARMHGQVHRGAGRLVLVMYNPAAGLHREELRRTIEDDFARALPAALAEARRLAALGQLPSAPSPDAPPPEQLSLF